jgi:hypothetical protein
MLGRLRMTVGQCIQAYIRLAKDVFGDPKTGFPAPREMFKATKLADAIKETVMTFGSEYSYDEKMLDTRSNACKVYVTFCTYLMASLDSFLKLRLCDSIPWCRG